MKLLNTKRKTLENINKNFDKNFVFKGLKKNRCAFILSPPDVGKSHFCLSMAIELTTKLRIFNLKKDNQPLKVIYWPIEDGIDVAAERLCNVLDSFDNATQTLIEKNLHLLDSELPIASSSGYRGSDQYFSDAETNRKALINIIKKAKCDVLIIDTLREAVGSADEVEDDYHIKNIVDEVANEADSSIVLVHHVTKNVAKGNEKLSSVSQSGLSRLGSKSKLHFSLFKDKDEQVTLHFTKANYLKSEERKSIQLGWNESGLLVPNDTPLKNYSEEESSEIVSSTLAKPENLDEETELDQEINIVKEKVNTRPKKARKNTSRSKLDKNRSSQILDIPIDSSNQESVYTKEQLRIMELKKAAKLQK